MDKNVSIVKVDKRNYRVIAQENWGLTKDQMEGKHVHHRIRRSDGGTNDPSNLYVCSPLYHDVVWHGETGGFIGLAAEGGKIGGKKVHEAKDGNGKSLHALNLHKEKDENGKSLHALSMLEKLHEEKDEKGKSLVAVKAGNKTHEARDEDGKSLHALRTLVKVHEEKDKNGKSLAAVKGATKTNEKKDKNGKSLQGLKNSDRLNEEKDENGKSLAAAKGGEKTAAQIWESPIDGFRGNAGNVAKHNRANGWDPNARIRVG
jgi:hypothetical protein